MRMSAGIMLAPVTKMLHDVQTKDLPRASRSAYNWAVARAVVRAGKRVAKKAKVPLWMVTGVGVDDGYGKKKKKGSRIGRTGYIRSMDGGFVYFRSLHINPGGTQYKRSKLKYTRNGVRMGAGKTSHLFPDSYVQDYGYWPSVYKRGTGGDRLQKIEIKWAPNMVEDVLHRMVRPAFKRRFIHDFNRRLKVRGAR